MVDIALATNTSFGAYSSELAESLRETAREINWDVYGLSFPYMLRALDRIGMPDGKVLDDTVRGMLALQACQRSEVFNVPLAIVDFKSSDDFKEELEVVASTRDIFVAEQQGGIISDAKREATSDAIRIFNPRAVGWQELEKFLMVDIMPQAAKNVPENGMLILDRSNALFNASYPSDQLRTEILTNVAVGNILTLEEWPYQKPPDLMSGTRVFDARGKMAKFMLEEEIPDHLGGDSYTGAYAHLMLLPLKAIERGMPVYPENAFYIQPEIQRQIEFLSNPQRTESYFDKRLRQMNAVVKMCYRERKVSEWLLEWKLREIETQLAYMRPEIEGIRSALRERR